MTNACIAKHTAILAGILALTGGTATLATEDRSTGSVVEGDSNGGEIFDQSAIDYDRPVISAQGRTLDLMLLIWTLKNNANDTK